MIFQVMEYFCTTAQRFRKRTEPNGLNHEFLNIHIIVCMLTTVNDIHHRHRHTHRWVACQGIHVLKQLLLSCCGRRLTGRQRYRQRCISAKSSLIFSTIQRYQRFIDRLLVAAILPSKPGINLSVDKRNRLTHTLSHIASGVTIAQFKGLTATGRRAGRRGRTAHVPAVR